MVLFIYALSVVSPSVQPKVSNLIFLVRFGGNSGNF
jgi:hypothetical protein